MIPKKIHYCWFGKGEPSELMKHCIDSWEQYNPGYEIIEWNESNCDLGVCPWVKEAHEQKKWAFIADYFRIERLVQQGGIYCDTDAEMIRSFDILLIDKFFMSFQRRSAVETHIIGSEPGVSFLKEILHFYDTQGSFHMTTINEIMTNLLVRHGMELSGEEQVVQGIYHIYPSNILSFDAGDGHCFAKHHHTNSWMPGYTGKGKGYHQRMVRVEYFLSKHPMLAHFVDIGINTTLWARVRSVILQTRIFFREN